MNIRNLTKKYDLYNSIILIIYLALGIFSFIYFKKEFSEDFISTTLIFILYLIISNVLLGFILSIHNKEKIDVILMGIINSTIFLSIISISSELISQNNEIKYYGGTLDSGEFIIAIIAAGIFLFSIIPLILILILFGMGLFMIYNKLLHLSRRII